MTYSAVIFDLDGTLIDSETVAQKAGIAAFSQFDVNVDFAFMLTLVGKDWPTSREIIRNHFGDRDFGAMNDVWHVEMQNRVDEIVPKPGAIDALKSLKCIGVPYAVATSSGTKGSARKLKLTGLSELVETIVTRDDVTRAKPHPEPYLIAASQLGVAPETCLAVEDTLTGVASAHAAGMTVLQVPDLIPAGDQAHFIGDDLLSGLKRAGLDLANPSQNP